MNRVTTLASVFLAAGLALSCSALAQSDSGVKKGDGLRPTPVNPSDILRGDGIRQKATATDPVPIKKIVLYRSGVGYFERFGTVDGRAEVQLRFNTDQINDILKSMILLDLDGGRIESVSYGSKEPLARRLASFGVNISENPSLPNLLNQLRGAPVKVLVTGEQVAGTILGVEDRILPPQKDQQPVKVPHLNLVTPTGLRSIAVTDISSFEIQDKELADELNKALAALAEYRADRTKTVDLRFAGQGARRVVVGYVHEMPVWKTSYRLVLPETDAKKPEAKNSDKKEAGGAPGSNGEVMLQGWAIVENTTDQDWNDVNLSLVSGRPVSFQMDLYEPLFTFRPFLPVPTIPGVMPRSYAGGTDLGTVNALKDAAEKSADRGETRKALRSAGLAAPGSPAPAPMAAKPMDGMGESKMAYGGVTGGEMADYAAAAQAQATEVGEVFQYQLEAPVSIERQRSAMIPILSTNIPGRRVSIFNIADNAGGGGHPMRGVEIDNKSNLQLLPGPISVFDGPAYAGDAQIGHIGQGDKRLLAYSVDLDVNVLTKPESESNVTHLRIVDGMFEQTVKSVNRMTYAFDNKDAKRTRSMVIEHAKYQGWDLVQPKKPEEETQNLYRFTVEIGAGKTETFSVVQERTERQSVGVTSIDMPTIIEWHKAGKLSDKVLQAVRDVASRQSAINTTEREIADLNAQVGDITAEQNRIRENMGKIDRASQLYTRYMTKLNDQETKLEEINDSKAKAQAKLEQQRKDFNDFIRSLNAE